MSTARPLPPHGYEAHPWHPVICAVVEPRRADAGVHVLLLPVAEAERQERYTVDGSKACRESGLSLLFPLRRPGKMGSAGRGTYLGATLHACQGGAILPGEPPPLPYHEGEREAFPFCFLVGIHAALQAFEPWRAWAVEEEIDLGLLHRHVRG